MNTTHRNESIILAVTRINNDITLRIDKNGFADNQFAGFPVIELKLVGCQDAAQLFDELVHSVNQALYYEIVKQDDGFTIRLWVNYEIEVACKQIDEVASDYTIEELKRKASRLAQLYLASTEASELPNYMYHLLQHKLSKMINKELDLYQRKIEFFSSTDPEKAATLTGEAQAYQKVLTLIGLGKVDGRPIESQIRSWLARINDDHIENQFAYAKSVESRIADLGQAALFPLLEMIKNAHPGYRREVIIILGMIDPIVQKGIMEILEPDDVE